MKRWRRGLVLLVAATAVGVVAVGPSAVARPPLGWNESAKVAGSDVLSFQVSSISIGKSGWSAHVSFRNVSGQTVRVGNVFGLTLYRGSGIPPTTRADAFGRATRFSPGKPARLKPGASWTGVITGTTRPQPKLSGKVYARVLFGPFYGVPGWPRAFFWITDHARTVQLTPSKPKGLVI